MEQVKNTLIEAKKTLLAYDDTTFYAKLVSGEALMVQAWDGWCNYGITDNKDIKYVIPKEGSDLWVDTMVVMKASENKDAAFQFINFMLDTKNHAWAAENILYKVPNKAAMESLPAELSTHLSEHGDAGRGTHQIRGAARRRRGAEGVFAHRQRDQGGAVERSALPLCAAFPQGGDGAMARRSGDKPDAGRSVKRHRTCRAGYRQTRPAFLMAPALAWLVGLMVVPCGLVLALAFFQRGIYGGVEYTFTLENFAQGVRPALCGHLPELGAHRRNRDGDRRGSGICRRLRDRIVPALAAAGAAVLRGAALLVELSHPHLCLDRALEPRGAGHAVAALVRL